MKVLYEFSISIFTFILKVDFHRDLKTYIIQNTEFHNTIFYKHNSLNF